MCIRDSLFIVIKEIEVKNRFSLQDDFVNLTLFQMTNIIAATISMAGKELFDTFFCQIPGGFGENSEDGCPF